MGKTMTLTDTLAAAFSRISLLVVDDKPLFRDMVRSAFLTKVKGVREAADTDKALDILAHLGANIGCVVCDWDMTPVGGIELLRMIRAGAVNGASPRTPVIILTTRSNPEAVRAAMELDVNGFVVAPVSLERLVETVGGALTRSWVLQQPRHYASVHGVMPPAPVVDKVPLHKVPRVVPRRCTGWAVPSPSAAVTRPLPQSRCGTSGCASWRTSTRAWFWRATSRTGRGMCSPPAGPS